VVQTVPQGSPDSSVYLRLNEARSQIAGSTGQKTGGVYCTYRGVVTGIVMVPQMSLVVVLVDLIDAIPNPVMARKPARPPTYPDRLFPKALVIMLVRDVQTVEGLLALLDQPTPEMQALRERLTCDGRFPSRRMGERRLNVWPVSLPARIACLGTNLVAQFQPWTESGAAVAIDSTVRHAWGGVWHKKDREFGVVPHSSTVSEARWTKSGWHGWVCGQKLHLVVTVAVISIPLAPS
jgi:hypothetical protein